MVVGLAKNKQKVLQNAYMFYLCICRLILDIGTNTKLSIHHTHYHNSQKQNGIRRRVLKYSPCYVFDFMVSPLQLY